MNREVDFDNKTIVIGVAGFGDRAEKVLDKAEEILEKYNPQKTLDEVIE